MAGTRLILCSLFCVFFHRTSGLINMATHKNTYQSSRYNHGYTWRAVDGCYDHDYYSTCGCTHTQSDAGAWWTVDLGLESTVHYVEILNRGDGSYDRLTNFKVLLLDDDPDPSVASGVTECAHYTGTFSVGTSGLERVTCTSPVIGRYVSIQLQGTNFLHVCEVEVWAEGQNHYRSLWNYAEGATVSMTDDGMRWHNDAAISSYANDDDHSTCTNGVEVTEDGKITLQMAHDVAVEKVRVYQSPK